jgi:hypothetical protein
MSSDQGTNPAALVPLEQDTTPTTLPPPYTGPTPVEEDADEEYNPQPPTTVYVNSSTTIQGSHNLVSSTPFETVHLTAAVMSALRQYNPQITTGNLHVRIDRSVNIVGDRNAVGAPGIRPRQPAIPNSAMAASVAAATAAAAARKRKAEEQSNGVPEAKRVSMRARSCPPS